MSAIPDNLLSFRYDRVSEDTGPYDAEQRRPTPGESSGGIRHVRIPYAVFTCPGMSHGAILLYGWLQQHNGDKGCFPSQAVLAEELGGGERSVRRYLAELEDAGFVRSDVRRGVRGGGSLATAYLLYPDGDAPTNRPKKDESEPANMAVSRDEPAKKARRTGQKVHDEPAKIDTPIKDESNPVNQTQLIKDSAPTERAAPPRKAAAKIAVTTPKEPAPTVGAKPEAKQIPRAKRASGDAPPKPNKFGAVLDAIRALGVEPIYNRGRDAKAVNECSEPAQDIAAAYVAVRRGEWGSQWLREHQHLWAVCADMSAYRAWEEAQTNGSSNGKATANASARPDQAGRPGRTPDVQGVSGGNAAAQERAEQFTRDARARMAELRRAMAAEAGDAVPGVPVPRG